MPNSFGYQKRLERRELIELKGRGRLLKFLPGALCLRAIVV
ncbi:hypothetical protein [Nostoc sp. CCY 9925]